MNLDELMKSVNESYAKNANVKIVFGEPIEKEGITIIPVAKVRAKVGEGNSIHIRIGSPQFTGKNSKEQENKEESAEPVEKKIEKPGFGIETKLTPMGYIEIKDGKAEYKPILDISRIAMMGICFAGFSVFMMTRMIAKIARFLSKNQHKCNCNCKNKEDSCCKEGKDSCNCE